MVFYAHVFTMTSDRVLTHTFPRTDPQETLSPQDNVRRKTSVLQQWRVHTRRQHLREHTAADDDEDVKTDKGTELTCRTNEMGFIPALCESPELTSTSPLKGFRSPCKTKLLLHVSKMSSFK